MERLDQPTLPVGRKAVPSTSPEERLGRTIGGYRVLSLLGEGGMGQVYSVEPLDASLHPVRYALKTLPPLTGDDEVRARFEREIVILRNLHHDNVTRLIDSGVDEGVQYLVMELLEGQTLLDHVWDRAPMEVPETMQLTRSILLGVEAIHELGVIHRDLKPANIFLTSAGAVKIMDFGISRQAGLRSLTATGTCLGTPDYLAPEQLLDSKRVDQRTDIFSVGLTVFQMLTRELPYSAPTLDQTLIRLIKNQGTPVTAYRSDLRPETLQWLQRALAFRREDRFATARQALEALPL